MTARFLFAKTKNNLICKKIVEFFYSPLYVILVGAAVFVFYSFGLDVISYCLVALTAIAVLILCEDTTPLIPLLVSYPFIRSMSWRNSGYTVAGSAVIIAFDILALLAVIYHMIAFGGFKRLKFGGRLWIGTVALGLGLLVAGFFCEKYEFSFFRHALRQIVPLCIVFFVIRATLKWKKESIYYLALSFVVTGIVMCGALAETYLFNKAFIESGYSKDLLLVGWGISNNIGAAILQAVPFTFYMACKEKKYPCFFYLAAVIMMICVVFTFSRATLLFGAPLFIACVVISCIKGQNRKQIIICTCVLFVAVVAVFAVMHDKIEAMLEFYSETGFNDRGRFEIYKLGFEYFSTHPIFGVGLRYKDLTGGTTHSYFYHNTPIQFLATGGIVGIATYALYRIQTIRLFTRKLNFDRLFLGLTIAAILLVSLLDNGFMRLFSKPFMILCLLFAERDSDYADWFYTVPALGKGKPLFIR